MTLEDTRSTSTDQVEENDTVRQPNGLRRVRYEEGVSRIALDAFADNPHQRNTVARAPVAQETYLAHLEDPHLEVAVVRCLANSKDYMLNGHTRREVWNSPNTKPSQIPGKINVMWYEADTIEDVVRGYEMFDSAQAVKTTGDEVYGALRQIGYRPTSPLIVNGSWLEAQMRAANSITRGKIVPEKVDSEHKSEMLLANLQDWLPEISTLDNIGFGTSVMLPELDAQLNPVVDKKGQPMMKRVTYPRIAPANMLAAALVILRRDGEVAVEFLTAIRDKKGLVQSTPSGDRFDAVRMVMTWGAYKRDEGIDLSLKNDDKRAYDYAVFFHAYNMWMQDRTSGDTTTMVSNYPKWSNKLKLVITRFIQVEKE